MSQLGDCNLLEIFDLGKEGYFPNLTNKDWEFLEYLVNESIITNRNAACKEQYKKLYKKGMLNLDEGEKV